MARPSLFRLLFDSQKMGLAENLHRESPTLLEQTLNGDQNMCFCVNAIRVGTGTLSGRDFGVLGLTETRLVYAGKTKVGVRSQMEWQLQKLDGIETEKTLLSQHVEITAGGIITKFLVDYGEAVNFVSNVNQAINSPRSEDNTDPDLEMGEGLLDSLERLGNLFESQLLSEEEFLAAKKKLLDD